MTIAISAAFVSRCRSWLVVAGIMALAMTGCGERAKATRWIDLPPAAKPAGSTAAPPVAKLMEGDLLRPFFFRRPGVRAGPYILCPGDELRIIVANRDDLGFTGMILPDGTMTLPLIGAMPVAGRSSTELIHELETAYRVHLKDARIDALILRSDHDSEMVWQALAAANQRTEEAAQLAVVDGVIRLPLIAPLTALNRPVGEVQAEAEAAYARLAPGIGVTLTPSRQRERTVVVLGEVHQPGRFPILRPISLFASLAQAGGYNDRANLAQVIVAQPHPDGSATVAVVDLHEWVDGGNAAGLGMELGEGAVVYVPRTAIADVNLFVQQYIRGVLPFDVNYSMVEPVSVFSKP